MNPSIITPLPVPVLERFARSILFTNVNGSGENCMVFTRLDVETLKAAYLKTGKITFDECYEVPGRDVQFYLYEPVWLTDAEEARAVQLSANAGSRT